MNTKIIGIVIGLAVIVGAVVLLGARPKTTGTNTDVTQQVANTTNQAVANTNAGLPPCRTPGQQYCDPNKPLSEDPALTGGVTAGMDISNKHCSGTDKPKLTHLPMNPEDFAFILPYGLMIGGHVTPIDHQYFSPTVFDSKPDAYNVFAMADSYLVDIGTRQHPGQGQNTNVTITDYRLVFAISCTLLYYYDLVTELAPGLQAQFDAANGNLKVTAGQLIGKIGGQTLDFAVWDTDKKLTGLIRPEQYLAEMWKLYTVDPLDYYADDIKAVALSKYPRTAEPRSGKIDYDVDSKLVGTWFQVGTNGYGGPGGGVEGYWNGHLSFAPDYLDPTKYVVSVGNWPGGASQFAVIGNTPDPTTVGVETGVVKFELAQINYRDGNQGWDRMSLPTSITMVPGTGVEGCFLAQLTDTRALKVEAFDGQRCSQVSEFTVAALMYER